MNPRVYYQAMIAALIMLGLGREVGGQPIPGDPFREDFESYPAVHPLERGDLQAGDFDPLGPWYEYSEMRAEAVQVVHLDEVNGHVLRWDQRGDSVSQFFLYPGGTGDDVLTISYLTRPISEGGIEMKLKTAIGGVHATVTVRTDGVKLLGQYWFRPTVAADQWYHVAVQADHQGDQLDVTIRNTYSTDLSAARLYDANANWVDHELSTSGSRLNPNVGQGQTWPILDNGNDDDGLGPWIEVALSGPGQSLTDVADGGDEYALIKRDVGFFSDGEGQVVEAAGWTVADDVSLVFHAYESQAVALLDDLAVSTSARACAGTLARCW